MLLEQAQLLHAELSHGAIHLASLTRPEQSSLVEFGRAHSESFLGYSDSSPSLPLLMSYC